MSAEQLLTLMTTLRDLGAYGGLGVLVWLLLTGRVVTRQHMNEVVSQVIAARDVQTAEAKAREDEWKRLAIRGIDIAVPLASAVKDLGAGAAATGQSGGS